MKNAGLPGKTYQSAFCMDNHSQNRIIQSDEIFFQECKLAVESCSLGKKERAATVRVAGESTGRRKRRPVLFAHFSG
jgi:hypothetical protein